MGEDGEPVVHDGVVHRIGDLGSLDAALDEGLHDRRGLRVDAVLRRELGGRVAMRLVDAGAHELRAQHRDTDGRAREFEHEQLAEGDRTVLRHRVRPQTGADESGHRRRVDDVGGPTPVDHAGHERTDAVEHAHQVHGHGPLELGDIVGVGIEQRAAQADTGVVAQDLDRPEAFDRGVVQCLHRRRVGHVGDDTEHRNAGRLEVGDSSVEGGRLDVGEHERRSRRGEPLRHREADTAGSARDDGGGVAEVVDHSFTMARRCTETAYEASVESNHSRSQVDHRSTSSRPAAAAWAS